MNLKNFCDFLFIQTNHILCLIFLQFLTLQILNECTCVGPKFPKICCLKLATVSISRCTEKTLSKGDIPPEWFYLRDMYDKFISCEN